MPRGKDVGVRGNGGVLCFTLGSRLRGNDALGAVREPPLRVGLANRPYGLDSGFPPARGIPRGRYASAPPSLRERGI